MQATSFGPWLKEQRKEFGYTQKEIADCVGCSAIAIRKIESGDYRPSRQIAQRLAECLEIPTDQREEFIRCAREGGSSGQWSVVSSQSSAAGVPNAPNNLPAPLTPLVGREEEAEAACNLLLTDGVRMLTLTGAGGIGKTRLGLRVAVSLLGKFENGVYFVNLAPIADPILVAFAIAQALGIKEEIGKPILESLKAHLRDKRVLLVLDNYEQVVASAPLVTELLAAAPNVKALVTSRERLSVYGEQLFPVPPLTLPDLSLSPSSEEISRYPAVRLFVERAHAVQPNFRLTDENAAVIVAICARLDGLPLAIELAAARIETLPPQEMLARLENRLTLLVGAMRDLPARQQTLRAAIGWSYGLLGAWEQVLFARLGVFAGGCTLAAVEAVCGDTLDGPSAGVIEGVTSLLDKSLLQPDRPTGSDSERRIAMLETIREYALECLQESGEEQTIRRWHAEYCLSLVKAAEPELRGAQQVAWLGRLEREHDNIRTALGWAERRDAGLGLQLAGALWRFWYLRGYLTEGRDWLESILSRADGDEHKALWAKALRGCGWVAYAQGDYAAARSLLRKSLVAYEELGDEQGVANALDNLGAVDFAQGENAAARALYERSLSIRKHLGDKHAVATSLNNLGLVATIQGEHDSARRLLAESLELFRDLGDGYGVAVSLNNLGLMSRATGDYGSARAQCEESLIIRKGMMDKNAIAYSLAGFAGVAAGLGQQERAIRLLGATHALLHTVGARLETAYRIEYERNLAAACAVFNEARFSTLWEEGQAMTVEQAIDYALADNGRRMMNNERHKQ